MIDKIALLYISEGKILSTRSKGKDKWYFPGGKREPGETDMQTLVREIREELNVEVLENTVRFYGKFDAQAHGKAEGVIVRMTCYTACIKGDLLANNEIEEIRWIDSSFIDCVSPVDRIIITDLKSRKLID